MSSLRNFGDPFIAEKFGDQTVKGLSDLFFIPNQVKELCSKDNFDTTGGNIDYNH